jgi:thiamine-phosphate pyrophosphorylase
LNAAAGRLAGNAIAIAARKPFYRLMTNEFLPQQRRTALRIIDANINRATEGLRVVEEFCRFGLSDVHLTRRCKELRHQLSEALATIGLAPLQAARDTDEDVGTAISTPAESNRTSLEHIATANWERIKQALRVIEEYVKLVSAKTAARIESLRYQAYTLEKACAITADSQRRLIEARLYVLIDAVSSECAWVERVRGLIDGGVDAIQLRAKERTDVALLTRARLLRQVIDESSLRPLFIMNDRADLAVLARADGVQVGQEDLPVREVRQIVGPDLLVGVSTHNLEQARQAVLDGANYLGCGPVFPSGTKHFDHFPGLDFLREVASEIALPAFAIGGITQSNLPQVLASGITRVAVGRAIWESEDPAAGVNAIRTLLNG